MPHTPRVELSAVAPRAHHAFWPVGVPWQPELPVDSLWHNLENTAAQYGAKAAYIWPNANGSTGSISYRELHERALALAGALQQRGVKKGDCVLLFMPNSANFVLATYAILRADAVMVPVNVMNRAEEFKHYLRDTDATVVITSPELAAVVDQALSEMTVFGREQKNVCVLSDLAAVASEGCVPSEHTAGPDDLAVMPYTSGTTGFPKGCMHTHATVMHNVISGTLWGSVDSSAVSLAVVPMFHVTGMLACMHTPVYCGATVVILPRWNRDDAAAAIARHQVTHWTCIPTMIIDLMASPRLPEFDLRSLRHIGGGGSAMPEAVAARLLEQFGLMFVEGYGLSETIAPSHANPPKRAKLQCLGIPYCGVDARVIDPQTLAELPVGEPGEIIINGPMVFTGYWRNPAATAQAFIELDGKRFFRSGDIGRVDAEGYFFITDRLKRMINASGYKVWPSEVENLLYAHPAIAEACIIGSFDAYRGETVKAVIVLREGARGSVSEQDIIDWARNAMAAYKYPRLVQFADALPKSGTGKVMWRKLQEEENAARKG